MMYLQAGDTVTETAAALGISRRTIQRWLSETPLGEELQRRKNRFVARLRFQASTLARQAVEVLTDALQQEHLPTAMHVLKLTGIVDGQPHDPHDGALEEVPAPRTRPAAKSATNATSATASAESLDSEPADLPERQTQAIAALLKHGDIAQAAEACGLHRHGLTHWCRTDKRFQQALRIARAEYRAAVHSRLILLAEVALRLVRKRIDEGDQRAAAWLTKGLGLGK